MSEFVGHRSCFARSTRILAGLMACSALSGLVLPQFALAKDQVKSDQQAPGTKSDNTIIVTGIRNSLRSALTEKRNAPNLVEVIKAEDIGKLPDQNLAEVLENITGIQITRTAGVGTAVQIRGTDANQTEINGVATVGSGAGRTGISFEDLPAAIIASVEVIKVPEAKTIEGSVGGTINLRTLRPLDLRKPLLAARFQMEHSDLARRTLPRISGSIGDHWHTGIGEIGIVMSGSYARQDVAEFEPRVDRDAFVLPGSGPSAQSFPFLRIQFLQQGQKSYKYKTYNGTASIAWKPADNLKFYFDSTINNQQRAQRSYRVQLSGVSDQNVVNATDNTAFETINLGTLNGPNGPIDLGTVQSTVAGTLGIGGTTGTTINPNLRTSSDTGARITHSRVFDLGADWQHGKLSAHIEGALSTSKSRFPNFSTTLDFINPHGPQPAYGGSVDNGVPLAFDLRNNILQFGIDQSSPDAPTSAELLDPANYRLRQVTQGDNTTDNKLKAVRLDLSYDTSDIIPFFKAIDVGYRWDEQTATNNTFTNNISLTSSTSAWNSPKGNLFSDILTPGPSNFNAADGRTMYFPDFLLISPDLSFSSPHSVLESLNSAITASNAAKTIGPDVPLLSAPTESYSGFFSITERTNALYAQLDYDTSVGRLPVRGNIGVRWLRTKVESTGNNLTNGTVSGQTFKTSSYSFFLPRFNLVLQPANKFLVRVGVARDIRRPDFDNLSTSYKFSTSATAAVQGGNPNLIPESVWSFDLSGEYYFTPSSLFSVGFFHKSRTNLFAATQQNPAVIGTLNGNPQYSTDPSCPGGGIYNPLADRNLYATPAGNGICAPLESTFNVPGSTTQTGIEVALQYDLSRFEDKLGWASGFGFIGNFTYQKSGGSANAYRTVMTTRSIDTGLGFPHGSLQDKITLTNLSKFAYNVTVYYDKYGLNARVRYTWRSSYTTNDPLRWNMPLVASARGQLNGSINYNLTKNINVSLEGINLLRGDQKLYCVNDNAVLCFQGLSDRRIIAGVSVKF